MTVGIVGLGLIGGSFARAYSREGHNVLACEKDSSVFSFAKLCGAVSGELTKDDLAGCDLILICVYPQAALDFMSTQGKYIGAKPVVIDCCGTKRKITEKGMEIAAREGYTYLGGHPMAGTQYSGFKYSKADMFKGAPMVIVPPDHNDIVLLDRVSRLLGPAHFGKITVTTADKHDEMIAFTSQLAHVVSSAYIKSPTALSHSGFSAGSYRDMTRVAWLNPEMWAQLFLDNKDNLTREIELLIKNLEDYRDAIQDEKKEKLVALLEEGKARKEAVDG